MNITLNNTDLTLTDDEMLELRKFAVIHGLTGKFYLAVDEDGCIEGYEHEPFNANLGYWDILNHRSSTVPLRNNEGTKVECDNWEESITIVNGEMLIRGFDMAAVDARVGEPAQADDGWTYIEDGVYPEHGQHVIVWDLRDNVYSGKGDNDKGQVQGGDCFYRDEKIDWDKSSDAYKARWKDYDDYQSMNGSRHRWSGQGPCSFGEVVAWRPFPTMPSRLGA